MDWRGPVILLALAGMAGLTWWLLRVATPLASSARAADQLPDYYFTGPRIVRYDTDGRVELDLTAERAMHHPQDDSVSLERLAVAYRTREGQHWRMSAARGNTPADGERITLDGDVSVTRADPGTEGGLELRTEQVLLDTAARRLTATGAVTLRDGATTMTAVGLVADLANDRIQLETRVRGSYATR